jgi:fibronectin type 3 domain-containing protein
MPLPDDYSDFLWKLQSDIYTTELLFPYSSDPKILAVLGCGWFDDNLKTNGTNQYRISKASPLGLTFIGEVSQRFPENRYVGTLSTLQFIPGNDAITIYYGLNNTTDTYNLKLYRSRVYENDYREIQTSTSFSRIDGQTVAVVRDNSVTKGIVYSYVAIPYDFLGNMGTPSDTINIYNLTNIASVGFVEQLRAVADKEKNGVSLSWKTATDAYIMGYELYRSKYYDIGYERIALLSAETTTWFDGNVDPAQAHYYFLVVNNGFGTGAPSARVPVILEGNNLNMLPPQNVAITLNKNIVQLTFNNIESDTRSYQIFRGEGYTGELSLIASIESTDSKISFTDTLALSVNPQTYSYAVADVNSSYNISPMSKRVSVQYGGGMLPIPSKVEAQWRGNEVFVVWDDMSQLHVSVIGYHLYRSTVVDDQTGEEAQIIATLPFNVNYYSDTLFIPGKHYRYSVASIDFNGETSNLSLHAGITIPRQLPLPPGQVTAIASNDRILLRWDNPYDPSAQSIRIYRATLQEQAALLKELPKEQNTFEDQTAKPDVQYFYYVVTVNTRNEESRPDEPVSGRIRR